VAIAVVTFTAWGVVIHEMELELPTPSHRFAYFARALTTLLTLAAWTVWQVRREERRLAVARERLREDEVALQAQQWRAEQAEGLAAFARVLAHELRNPLNAMALHTTLMKRNSQRLGAAGEPLHATALVLDEQMRRVNELLEDYLAYAKGTTLVIAPEPLALDALAAEAVASHRDALTAHGVHCHVHRRDDLPPVRGDRGRLLQAIHHLLENSMDALPDGGRVDIRASAEGGQVVLTVSDDGPGFSDPEVVFRPFFTTHHAAGLGLAVVRDIVRAHRGEVGASNGRPGGARITLRLPAEEGTHARSGAP
jgi:signal transduction histidine kinase